MDKTGSTFISSKNEHHSLRYSNSGHSFQKMPNIAQQNQLDVQLLRVRSHGILKQIEQIFTYSEEQICQFFTHFQDLPMSKIKAAELFQIEGAKLVRTENKIYLGEIQEKKKHGKGLIIYRQGRIFQGYFANNEKHSFGCEVYPNGNLYVGEFSCSKKHGKGSLYWFSLADAEKECRVQQYHGEWWGGLPDGEGCHLKANGDYYEGKFKNGLKHGDGIEYYNSGDYYKGEFINGFPQGYGQYTWNDTSHYRGDFKQGHRNGYGMWRQAQPSDENYKGHYILDKKQGYGIYDWGNGLLYKGNFFQDIRSGYGELYSNGELIYKGYWQKGERHGKQNLRESPQQEQQQRKREQDRIIQEQKLYLQKMRLRKQIATKGKIQRLNSTDNCYLRRNRSKKKLLNSSYGSREKLEEGHSRIGHRNCIPCQVFGRHPAVPRHRSKRGS